MEGGRNRRRNRAEAPHSSSTSDSDSLSDVRSQIEQISLASESDDSRGRSRRISRRQRNLDLYDVDYRQDSCKESLHFDDFVEDHQIIADIRSVNGGLNYSNKKLERLWGARQTDAVEDSPPSLPDAQEEWPPLTKAQLERKKYRKNVAVTSLLEERERRTRSGDEPETEEEQKNSNEENKDPNACHFIQDPIEPDFFYRPTTVTDSDIDFTVPHVGKVTVVEPRQYFIENFDEKDIAFCRRESRRGKDEKPST